MGLIVGAGCLTLLAGAAGFTALVLLLTGGAADAAKGHLEQLARGNIAAAYQEASLALREQVSLEAYSALVQKRPAIARTRSISVPERNVENGISNLTAQVTDDAGVVRPVPMRLRKESGTWRVIAVDLTAFPTGPVEGSGKPSTSTGSGPRVGSILIGSGRNEAGALLNPGKSLKAAKAETVSADIALIDHPLGGSVQAWLEDLGSGRGFCQVSATLNGEGSADLPLDLLLGEQKLKPGRYQLVILLGEDKRFTKEFEVQ